MGCKDTVGTVVRIILRFFETFVVSRFIQFVCLFLRIGAP